MISHTCQSASAGQPKADRLAAMPDIDLMAVVPDRWREYREWRTPDSPLSESEARYRVLTVKWPWTGPGSWYLHWYPGLKRLLETFRPDIIDLWEEPWGLVSAQAVWLRNRLLPGARIVTQTEQNIDKRLPVPFESFRRHTLRNASFAIGRSAEAIEVLRHKGYRGEAGVVPNGVDIQLFRPLDRGACRRKLGFEGFIVGYVGRLTPEKGLMDLIEALPHCAADVQVAMIGDGAFKRHLEVRAAELGVGGRLRWLPSVAPKDLPEVMNAIDALVLPSHTTARWKEQFGRVLIEAMACGTPVIGSSSGAIPEVIGDAGLIFRERSQSDLKAKIALLRGNPEAAIAMGESGRRRVIGWASWDRVAERMAGIYRQVASSDFADNRRSPHLAGLEYGRR